MRASPEHARYVSRNAVSSCKDLQVVEPARQRWIAADRGLPQQTGEHDPNPI
jgi:hypothetical protein